MKPKNNNKDRFVIIMAGGRGERFWPVSRERTPKQLIKLLGDRSFLQQAVDRVTPLVPLETIGIKPTEPATGYGYIHTGNVLPPPAGVKKYKTTFFKAERFVEKPDYDTALTYVNSGQYRWNAGMFIWSFVTVTNGLQAHQPEMFAACERWFQAAKTPGKLAKVLAKEYPEIKKVSIDYALMEKAQNVVVADGSFAWDDLGSWNALAHHIKPDAEGNCAMADFIHVDAARNIIFDGRSKDRRTPICIVGLRDSIVVQTDDATLVAHKSQSQKIKELVKKLAEDARLKKLV
ncbi:MAG: hypothetical protein EBS05_12120 [Proteobacteria bacterium]|nr:hypothetical protein [Pseudomonadota bacterium]